jgi:hypothetical protein
MTRTLGIAFLLSLSSAAFAAEPIDFAVHIKDLDGKEIFTAKDAPALTLKEVALQGLLFPPQEDPRSGFQPQDPVKAFELELQISKGGLVSLSAEDIAFLKNAIRAHFAKLPYGSLFIGRANELLDPVRKP